jgi:hypothetical protein
MTHLTEAERQTLNAAMDIILSHTALNSSWSFGANGWHGSVNMGCCTYFTSSHTQHSFLPGETFADKIEAGLELEAQEQADADGRRARRVEALRAELSRLTGEAA